MRKIIKNVEEALKLFEEQIIISGIAQDADDYKLHNKCKVIIDKCIVFLYEQGQLEALHTERRITGTGFLLLGQYIRK